MSVASTPTTSNYTDRILDTPPAPVSAPAPPPSPVTPPPPPPPYATGTCKLHLTEWAPRWERFNDDGVNYAIAVDIFDAAGAHIGGTPRIDSSRQPHIPSINSKLPDPLIVLTQDEQHGGYIQFTLGNKAWPSNNQKPLTPEAHCDVGGWDGMVEVTNESNRQMDCWFPC